MLPAFEILLKGIGLGLAVSIPLGPVGILLVNRTLKRGMLSGFFSGMGLATADTIFAVIAGLGLSFIVSFFNQEKVIISLIAGLVLVGAGVRIFISNPVKELRNPDNGSKTLFRDFLSVLALALSNPFTIFVFVAFFSGIHINNSIRPQLVPFLFVPGVFIGTISWWFLLSFCVSRFKRNIRLRSIVRVNQFAGIAIIVTGVAVLVGVFTTLFS